MRKIDTTALIEDGAVLGQGVEIGPYAIIGAGCRIGDGSRIGAFTICEGRVVIGIRCSIGHHAVLGTPPQDVSYQGEESGIEIGDETIIREFVTIHRSTGLKKWTRIGKKCFIMAYGHIAHNCLIGDEVTLANGSTLAGYVTVEDQATLSGLVGVHQFVRIGRLAMIGGLSKVIKDVPPYTLADGHPVKLYGLNKVGMQRRGVSQKDREVIK
ncbi:MAG TPA: acyl-ACP--UDP-N-acetylglucosamine O-acyltransferase, partial [Atribacteraceae bacterium]|nr:acyl-ACP--UDP-N-acetylglucosamine O-acyltransferase [Atribacteraceae bacterium]